MSGSRATSPAGPRAASLEPDPDTGRPVGRSCIRVRYAETDRMGVANNAHYLTWFEIGRTELMRSAGIPYREVEERGVQLPVVDLSLQLRAPARYDDILNIETRIDELRSRTLTFAYRILCQEMIVASGRTVHASVRASDGRGARFPPWLADRLRQLTS